MIYQIDQSGKIEDTNKDTVLALAGKDFSYTLKISAKAKRDLQSYFRDTGEPTLFIYKSFAAGIFILLNTYNVKITSVVIDQEYPGKEELINKMLHQLFNIFGIGSRIYINFGKVGKASFAHDKAYLTAVGRQTEDRRVGFMEIKKIVSCLSPE